ncbi:carboxypeptidase-like regulatory domain-containing protein, partial [Candidatus Woesearchaeota archaeon]|nr:carboxypeptidase-like regulatory domain-containing protein [Candidatus Woesearchaeota archaeon]
MRKSTLIVVFAALLIVISSLVYSQQPGCCATNVCEDSTDEECSAAGGTFYSGKLCTAVADCGCCICNPNTAPFVFTDNIYSSSGCVAACAVRGAVASTVVPGFSIEQCQGLGGRTVTGRVTDQRGNPLYQATINSSKGRSANTNTNGEYTLTLVNTGDTINAFYRGISSTQKTIAANVDVYTFIIQVPVTATLKGRVVDSAGNPINGVVVSVDFKSDTTDSSGNYEITGLLSGTFAVTASKTGYPPFSQPVTFAQGEQKTLDITLVSGAGTLTGTVKDASGNPIANTVVQVQGYPQLFDATDSAGRYSIANTPFATIVVSATPSTTNYIAASKTITFSATNNVLDFVLQSTGPCADGTPRGVCSFTRPKFCTAQGILVNNYCYGADQITGTADDCGCPTGFTCEIDGSCSALEQRDCCDFSFQCYGLIPPDQA